MCTHEAVVVMARTNCWQHYLTRKSLKSCVIYRFVIDKDALFIVRTSSSECGLAPGKSCTRPPSPGRVAWRPCRTSPRLYSRSCPSRYFHHPRALFPPPPPAWWGLTALLRDRWHFWSNPSLFRHPILKDKSQGVSWGMLNIIIFPCV